LPLPLSWIPSSSVSPWLHGILRGWKDCRVARPAIDPHPPRAYASREFRHRGGIGRRSRLRRWTTMKPSYHCRACPNCGNQVGWTRMWLRLWGWSHWPCPCCGSMLKIDTKRHLLGTMTWGLWMYFCITVLEHHFGLPTWLAMLVFFYGLIPALAISGVRLAKNSRQISSCDKSEQQRDPAVNSDVVSMPTNESTSNPSDGSDAPKPGEEKE